MGVPKGYINRTVGDTYHVGIEENGSIVFKDMKSLNLTMLGKQDLTHIFAGSTLFFYDTKNKEKTIHKYAKCWLSYNTITFRTSYKNNSELYDLYKLQVFNPQGSDGMIIWLDTSITAENLKEFDIEPKKKLEEIISECKSKPDTVYVDTVKKFITTSLNSYQAGNVMLTQELKNKIIESKTK